MTNLCEDHSWAGEGDCPKCESAFRGLVPAQAEPRGWDAYVQEAKENMAQSVRLAVPVAEPAQQGTKDFSAADEDRLAKAIFNYRLANGPDALLALLATPQSGQGTKAPTNSEIVQQIGDKYFHERGADGAIAQDSQVLLDAAYAHAKDSRHTTFAEARTAFIAGVKWQAALAARSGEGAVHHGLDSDDRVCFYEQDFYVLSNFSSFNLQWKGRTFPTSEHAYHWEKFLGMEKECPYPIATKILNAPSAHTAFKVAEVNRHQRRPDWDDVKIGIMREILRAKADQHEYVRRKLLATGDRELIENSWRDSYWGWGPKRDGKNMLGKLWMEVRAELVAALQHTA